MRSETLCKNVEMHILETGKFKDVILSFRFFNELKTPDSWVRTVLALMLADRCEKYPTKRRFPAAWTGCTAPVLQRGRRLTVKDRFWNSALKP